MNDMRDTEFGGELPGERRDAAASEPAVQRYLAALAKAETDPCASLIELIDCLLACTVDRTVPRPTWEQHDCLLKMHNAMDQRLRAYLGKEVHYPIEKYQVGWDATFGLGCHWYELDAAANARSPDIVLDLRDYAAIFQNDLKTMALEAAIKARKSRRVDDNVTGCHPWFGEELSA